MSKIAVAAKQNIRHEAEKFLSKYGFIKPPLPPDEALAARKLEVSPLSLDDLLVKANLPQQEQARIQAMLDVDERIIVFKNGLHNQKQNWGKLHEIGHEFLPWHRELLYYCPLLGLPANVQDELEAEADIFAAETFFFGSEFNRWSDEGPFGLTTAKDLADTVYFTSFQSTFVHYVQESNIPCCLLVWRPVRTEEKLIQPRQLQLHYYVPSRSFKGGISTGTTTEDTELLCLLSNPANGIIKHDVQINFGNGKILTVKAESFSNSYNVFTLMLQPD